MTDTTHQSKTQGERSRRIVTAGETIETYVTVISAATRKGALNVC